MNKGLVRSTYISWLLNDKHILTFFMLICLNIYTIQPIIECAEIFNEPINLLEPFITIIGNAYCIPIVVIAFLITIIDYPDMSGNTGFILIRTGRIRWYLNQLLFLIAAIVTYIFILFVFSIIFTAGISFIANAWSNTVNNLERPEYQELKRKNFLATIDLSVLNNFRPYVAVRYSIILFILQVFIHGQIQIFFSVRFNKIAGVIASIGTLGAGLALWAAGSNFKWIFPFSHGTIGWHYGELFKETFFPLFGSFVYLIIINIILYIIGQINIKHKQFYLEVNVDDSN